MKSRTVISRVPWFYIVITLLLVGALWTVTQEGSRKLPKMNFDPLTRVIDEPLKIDTAVIRGLENFRAASKLDSLPGVDTRAERARLSSVLNNLADRLIDGIRANPNKLWVMRQFQLSLVEVKYEDTEGREHFGTELEKIMDVLGIASSNGLINYYLGYW